MVFSSWENSPKDIPAVNSGIVGLARIATILGETGREQQVSGDVEKSSSDSMFR